MLNAVSVELFESQIKGLTPRLLSARGWLMHEVSYPIIDCSFLEAGWVGLRVRMDCSKWDEEPPSIQLFDVDGNHVDPNLMPRGTTNVFNSSLHQNTNRPFVCMVGAFEYHTHSSHLNDHWSLYRGKSGYSLGEILSQLWNAWKKDRKKC